MKHFRPHPVTPPLPSRLGHVDPLACRALRDSEGDQP